MKLFNSLVMSVLLYTIETVPMEKQFVELLRNFVVKCYKTILNIDSDIRVNEKNVTDILGITTIDEVWSGRNLNATSHISRLPFRNTARVVLFGKPRYIKKIKPRKYMTVKESLMKEVHKWLTNDTLCRLCDRKIRKIRSANLHQAQ